MVSKFFVSSNLQIGLRLPSEAVRYSSSEENRIDLGVIGVVGIIASFSTLGDSIPELSWESDKLAARLKTATQLLRIPDVTADNKNLDSSHN